MVWLSSVSGHTILLITRAPGAAIRLAAISFGARSIPACAPMATYTTRMLPAMQARLPVMLASSSLLVMPFR